MKLLKILILIIAYFMPCNNHAMNLFSRAFVKVVAAKYMPQLIKGGTSARTKIASAITGTSAALANCFKKTAKAEHYYTKENGEQLTKEEHAVAYEAMLNHQFPMAPYYNKEYDPTKNETEQIQKELDQKAPGLKAHWIPTTVYELLHIDNIGQMFSNHEDRFKKRDFLGRYHIDSNYEFNTIQNIQSTQNRDRLTDEHARFNEIISDKLKKDPYVQNESEKNYWKLLIFPIFRGKAYQVIDRAIDWEVENKNTTLYPLYRGGSLDEREFSPKQIQQISNDQNTLYNQIKNTIVSYGNTLYAGTYCDEGACAGEFIRKSDMGYVLPIDKTNPDHKKLFFIPPLTTLNGLFSFGELFHSRTKILSQNQNTNIESIKGIERKWIDKLPNYLITPIVNEDEAKEKILQRQKYVIENAVPLTPKTADTLKNAREILAAGNAKKAGDES